MELFFITLLCIFLSSIFLSIHLFFHRSNVAAHPPGKTGWPVIGESLEYLSACWKGHPEKFFLNRMLKYSSAIFRTSLFGDNVAVFCGAAGNKFIFSNEDKLVQGWRQRKTMRKILPNATLSNTEGYMIMRKVLDNVLKAEALHRYIPVMENIACRHFADEWENKEQVTTSRLTRNYTFWIACHHFVSMKDPDQFHKFRGKFEDLVSGLASFPIALPGTQFWKAIKRAEWLRKELVSVIRKRKIELAEGNASLTQDILSLMLVSIDDDSGKSLTELSMADNITGILVAGHDTSTSVLTMIVKYLAELPHVYDAVYKEQMEIAKSKADGESLNWEDLQKMKYSWNVVCEAMRVTPPASGSFREAITNFTYNGFFIPKGSKLFWSTFSTHKNSEFFPDPEKFDPTRFEGSGPAPYTFVPFGGGPRMCPGKEFVRIEILVFMHHLVKRFKWEKIIPDEKIMWNPAPVPVKGLPIKLYPYLVN